MAKILIVDDSKMMRRNLRKILAEAGHEVVAEAEDGSDACKAYAEHRPDLVTMDINMPVMDGIEAVKRILVDFPEANIVMISAHNEQNRVYQAVKCGAKNYIVKAGPRRQGDDRHQPGIGTKAPSLKKSDPGNSPSRVPSQQNWASISTARRISREPNHDVVPAIEQERSRRSRLCPFPLPIAVLKRRRTLVACIRPAAVSDRR